MIYPPYLAVRPFLIWSDNMWRYWIESGIYPPYFGTRLLVAIERDLDFLGYYKGVKHYRINSQTFIQ